MSPPNIVLVLGVSGMLGNAVFRFFSGSPGFAVWGSARSTAARRHFQPALQERIVCGIDVEQPDQLAALLAHTRPQLIVNCIGLVKQVAEADDPLMALPINALLAHRLARLASLVAARLVHVSTDCVFAVTRGGYR